ncbi:hypothetical protein KI387_038208, partial [Taxus chinensis]
MTKIQAKRLRTISSLTVNSSGERVIEVATPIEGKTKETITSVDYRISMFSFGKDTHEGAKKDVHATLGALLEKNTKDKATKNELKAKVEKLTTLLRKVAQPTPSNDVSTTTAMTISSTINDIYYHELEKLGQKAISVEKITISKMEESFSKDNNNLNLTLETWSDIREEDSNFLLQEEVIDDASKLFEYQKVMELRCQVLQDLIKKLEKKQVKITDALNDISEEFDNTNYNLFNENIDVIHEDQIKENFKDLV